MRPRLLVALLTSLSLLLLAVPGTRAQSVNEDDRAALKAFYAATDGDNWTNNTGWDAIDTTSYLGDLHGVSVDAGGTERVTDLDLADNNLTGSIRDLGKLVGLEGIWLQENQLTGSIPDLSKLTGLRTLHLHENQLTGSIPGLPDSLEDFRLHTNQLTGRIPAHIGNMTSLQDLHLYTNQLSGPIPDLSKLTSLVRLYLFNNQLNGSIPPGLPTSLLDIRLQNNKLSGEIPDLSALTSLSILSLRTNQLRGPIPDLSKLTSLTHLLLHTNQLSGPIPTGLPTSLQDLHLHTNQLRGPIPDLRSLTGLDALPLYSNQLGLDASGQKIATPDLDDLMPTSLSTLTLNHNQLSGPLPDVDGLTNLQYFYIRNNDLSGPLPDLSNLSNLLEFSIRNNKLGTHADGTTVTDISGLAGKLPAASLLGLWLSNNGLSGEIPDLSSLSGLTTLWLQDNQLTGSIPNTLPTGLGVLYLHTNQLSGPLTHLSRLTSLYALSLYDNPQGAASTLHSYPSGLNSLDSLQLLVPNTGYTMCLYGDADGPAGSTACTIPTKVDQLRLTPTSPTALSVTWVPQADPAPSGYAVQYFDPDPDVDDWVTTNVAIVDTTATITGLTSGGFYTVRVRPDSADTPWLSTDITLPTPPPPPPPTTGGGGSTASQDRHGDTPDEATSLNPRRYTTGPIRRRINAQFQGRGDVDYFKLDLPYAGILTASTTGGYSTTGRLSQAQAEGEPLLIAEDRGPLRAFRLGTVVEPGTYYLAVSSEGSFGHYRLRVDYTPAAVGNPAPDSFQSGVSVLSGWVCDADTVEIELVPESGDPQTYIPATGTSRPDTAVACGSRTTDTGYGLLFNWNRLGDGQHTVRVFIDDVLVAERTITVTTLGEHPDQEFRTDLTATTEVADFPAVGETTTLRWETARQNFMIASGAGGGTGAQLTPEQAWLGNPAPGSFQSGIGVISGWVCDAETVELAFETATGTTFTEEAGYGTERGDMAGVCGDTDKGFGLLFNWNRLGDGQHTVRAYADGEEFGHSTFNVTTLGAHVDEEFRTDLRKTHTIADFPAAGQTTTVEWQTGQQNFVITRVE